MNNFNEYNKPPIINHHLPSNLPMDEGNYNYFIRLQKSNEESKKALCLDKNQEGFKDV